MINKLKQYYLICVRTIGAKCGLTLITNGVFFQLYDSTKLSAEERAEKDVAVGSKDHSCGGTKAVVEFTAASISVMENEGKVRVGIRRQGRKDIPCCIQ